MQDLKNNLPNILKLDRLDDAWISSRHFQVRANREDVVPLLRFVADIFDEYISGL